jgi:hypothetical protein
MGSLPMAFKDVQPHRQRARFGVDQVIEKL